MQSAETSNASCLLCVVAAAFGGVMQLVTGHTTDGASLSVHTQHVCCSRPVCSWPWARGQPCNSQRVAVHGLHVSVIQRVGVTVIQCNKLAVGLVLGPMGVPAAPSLTRILCILQQLVHKLPI
jgi:hypothetical protein